MEPRRWVCLATMGLLFAAALALPAQTRAAQPNQLVAPTVSPRVGTPATTFVFSVTYEARDPALAVVAIVGGQTVGLALVSGTTTSGTYRGESQLPAGTWTVTFSADAERGNDPIAAGGTVQVDAPTPVPTPIPAPTAPPAVATPAPTPPPVGPVAPAPATPVPPGQINSPPPAGEVSEPGSSIAPVPSSLEEHAGTPGGAVFSLLPSAAAGAVGSIRPEANATTDTVMPILLGGLAVIGVVAASGVLLGARGRRRQDPEAAAVSATEAGPIAPADEERARASSVWELDAQLEDEKIGTVDYLPLENGEAVGESPADLPAAAPPRRVNPRAARIEAARAHRPASARRSLLGR